MGFNSSTGLNAEASAYVTSQTKAKQELKRRWPCILAHGEQQWRGEKAYTWRFILVAGGLFLSVISS